jgi:magnesium transporter
MSNNEDGGSDAGYFTSLPELDDHCYQIATFQRPDSLDTNRSIFDSFYGMPFNTDLADSSGLHTLDGEDGVGENIHDITPGPPYSRYPSSASGRRSVPPSNSVKAFTEARRQVRDNIDGTVSVASQHDDHEFNGLTTTKSPGEDVYCPMLEGHRGRNLLIDFDFLETLIEPETRQQAAIRVFPSLLPASTVRTPACETTSDGEFINILPDKAFMSQGEAGGQIIATAPQQRADLTRFSFFSSAWEATIHAAEFGGLILPGETVQGLFSFPMGENCGVWWLNMNNPTGEEIRTISKAFGIHPLTIEDIITQENREKIELFPSYYFACFRSFRSVDQPDGIDYTPFNMYVVVFREGTLSFSFAPDAHATRVRARISRLKEYVSLSSDWICYALM